ncbi:MAG: amino acid transporter [Solirubrobacterales bacterium]|nr:amino acid transporter [Solirubrobacterales bacterium]MCB0860605.1 amino acid transporter [Solirubrobacterales bacterium]
MNVTLLQMMLLGFAASFTLIVAIGAQNAYLLRLGVEGRGRVLVTVILICALSDAVLIAAGVAGVGAVLEAAPAAVDVVRMLGAVFLISYGVMAARRALAPQALTVDESPAESSMKAIVLTTLAFTWLNPHVYLDTVMLLGSIANQHDGTDRWWWALGAVTASFCWFFLLGYGARLLKPLFARPAAWRVLDILIALIMVSLGAGLIVGL